MTAARGIARNSTASKPMAHGSYGAIRGRYRLRVRTPSPHARQIPRAECSRKRLHGIMAAIYGTASIAFIARSRDRNFHSTHHAARDVRIAPGPGARVRRDEYACATASRGDSTSRSLPNLSRPRNDCAATTDAPTVAGGSEKNARLGITAPSQSGKTPGRLSRRPISRRRRTGHCSGIFQHRVTEFDQAARRSRRIPRRCIHRSKPFHRRLRFVPRRQRARRRAGTEPRSATDPVPIHRLQRGRDERPPHDARVCRCPRPSASRRHRRMAANTANAVIAGLTVS